MLKRSISIFKGNKELIEDYLDNEKRVYLVNKESKKLTYTFESVIGAALVRSYYATFIVKVLDDKLAVDIYLQNKMFYKEIYKIFKTFSEVLGLDIIEEKLDTLYNEEVESNFNKLESNIFRNKEEKVKRKIHIMRHYEVDLKSDKRMTSDEYVKWTYEYDEASVILQDPLSKIYEWSEAYCSDLRRALLTANNVTGMDLIITDDIREIRLTPPFKTRLKLSKTFWDVTSFIAWRLNHKSQVEKYKESKLRIKRVIDRVLKSNNKETLIVTHGIAMTIMKSELLKSGFVCDNFYAAKNGNVYTFDEL